MSEVTAVNSIKLPSPETYQGEKKPGFRARYEFDKYYLVNAPEHFLRNFDKYKSEPYAKDFLVYAIQHASEPEMALYSNNYKKYQDEPYASEILRLALDTCSKKHKDSHNTLYWLGVLIKEEKEHGLKIDHKIIDDFLKTYLPQVAQNEPYRAQQYYKVYKDKPFGEEIIKTALNKLLETRPGVVITFIKENKDLKFPTEELLEKAVQSVPKKQPDYFFENYDSYFKNRPDVKVLLEKAARSAAKTKSAAHCVLNNHNLIKGEAYYDEVINEALLNIGKDYLGYCINHFDIYKDRNDAKEILLKAITARPGYALHTHYYFRDAPFFKEALEVALRLEAKEYYGSFVFNNVDLFKDEPYAEEILKLSIDSQWNPVGAITSYEKYKDKPYAEKILHHAIDKLLSENRDSVISVSGLPVSEAVKKKVLMEIAMKNPSETVRSYKTYKHLPFANEVLSLALQESIEKKPGSLLWISSFESLDPDVRKLLTDEVLKKAAMNLVAQRPFTALSGYKYYKGKPFAKEVLERAMEETIKKGQEYYKYIFDNYSTSKEKDIIDLAVPKLAGVNPYMVLSNYELWKDNTYAEEYLELAVRTAAIQDPFAAAHFYDLYKDKPYGEDVIKTASELCSHCIELWQNLDTENRQKCLVDLMKKTNPQFVSSEDKSTAIDFVQKELNQRFAFVGINTGQSFSSAQKHEFVFVNLPEGDNYVPLRLSFNYNELKNARTKDEAIKLIQLKITQEKERLRFQHIAWGKKYGIHIPTDGSAAVMITAFPGKADGIETDYSRICRIYLDDFKASVYGICMENKDTWDNLPDVQKMRNDNSIPQAIGTSEKKLFLDTLKKSVTQAIDKKKNCFVLHYTLHGTPDGRMNAGIIFATKEDLHPEEIAEVLSSEHNGKPVCEQIDITIIAESCFAKAQKDKLFAYFQGNNPAKKKIPVKGLTMVASTSDSTPSFAATSPKNCSMTCDKSGDDLAGTFNYNFSNFFELINTFKIKFNQEHLFKFIDRMSMADSPIEQDLQIFYYMHNPDTKEETYRQFGAIFENLKNRFSHLAGLFQPAGTTQQPVLLGNG